jgi:hypothetical protein
MVLFKKCNCYYHLLSCVFKFFYRVIDGFAMYTNLKFLRPPLLQVLSARLLWRPWHLHRPTTTAGGAPIASKSRPQPASTTSRQYTHELPLFSVKQVTLASWTWIWTLTLLERSHPLLEWSCYFVNPFQYFPSMQKSCPIIFYFSPILHCISKLMISRVRFSCWI